MKPRSPPLLYQCTFFLFWESLTFPFKAGRQFFPLLTAESLCLLSEPPVVHWRTGGDIITSEAGFWHLAKKWKRGRIFYICQKWKRFLLIFNGIPLREDANTTLRRLKLLFVSFDCHPSGMLPPVREWQQDSCCRQWMHLIARLMLSKIPNEMFQWKHFKG